MILTEVKDKLKTVAELKNEVQTALENAGYTVAEGRADLFTVEGAEKLIPAFNTCFGNNPAAPYIVPAVPHREGEAYDYGKSMRSEFQNAAGEDLYWTFRLEEDEAIIMFGNLPPEAAFIGYETFLFTRNFDPNALDSSGMDWLTNAVGVQHHLSPNPDNLLYDSPPIVDDSKISGDEDEAYRNNEDRVILFANGPTINRRNLENKIGVDFWGKQAIFSTSADAGFEAALNAELEEALAEIHIHSPLGSELNMGLSSDADDFWPLMRYAVPNPDNKLASKAWRKHVASQLVVFRVSKSTPPATVVRHPTYVFEEKRGNSEKTLAVDLQRLADAVSSELGFDQQKGSSQEVCLPCSSIPLHAPQTMPLAMSAVGATNDADYRITSARPFGREETLAVVGVNHTETDNASYISLGIYNAEVWQGVKAVSQGRGWNGPLTGSAEGFFNFTNGEVPEAIADIDLSKFYVHVVTRPGAGVDDALEASDYCTVVDWKERRRNDVVLERGKRIRLSSRAYLNPDPKAGCGPDHTKLLSMILLVKGADGSDEPTKPAPRSSR